MRFSSLRSALRRNRGYQPQVEQLENRFLMNVAPAAILPGVYKDLLGRPADPQGVQFWTGQMAGGASELQVVQQIEQSPEARQAEVRGLYTTLLGRKADPGGVAYFTSQLQAGASLANVEAEMLASTEYMRSRGDHTSADFLSSAFRDLLGRKIEPNALVSFGQLMGHGSSLAAVADAIASSPEAVGRFLRREYQRLLKRSADPAGLQFWTTVAQSAGYDAVLAGLLSSPEYAARFRDPTSLEGVGDPLSVLDANKGIVLT